MTADMPAGLNARCFRAVHTSATTPYYGIRNITFTFEAFCLKTSLIDKSQLLAQIQLLVLAQVGGGGRAGGRGCPHFICLYVADEGRVAERSLLVTA